MIKDDQAILFIVSRFLDYPDQAFMDEAQNLDAFVKKYISSEELREEVSIRLKPLVTMSLTELQEHYVSLFDYKEKTGLYLTSQELGDSRKRGGALIQLQKLIEYLGFEHIGKELADYMPMLLELAAVAEDCKELDGLKKRLAYAGQRIFSNLAETSPYYHIFDLLMSFALKAPTADEISQVESGREEADLDDMPYPMLYL